MYCLSRSLDSILATSETSRGMTPVRPRVERGSASSRHVGVTACPHDKRAAHDAPATPGQLDNRHARADGSLRTRHPTARARAPISLQRLKVSRRSTARRTWKSAPEDPPAFETAMPIVQALTEFAPGRASRRFGVTSYTLWHWVPTDNHDSSGERVVDIETFVPVTEKLSGASRSPARPSPRPTSSSMACRTRPLQTARSKQSNARAIVENADHGVSAAPSWGFRVCRTRITRSPARVPGLALPHRSTRERGGGGPRRAVGIVRHQRRTPRV